MQVSTLETFEQRISALEAEVKRLKSYHPADENFNLQLNITGKLFERTLNSKHIELQRVINEKTPLKVNTLMSVDELYDRFKLVVSNIVFNNYAKTATAKIDKKTRADIRKKEASGFQIKTLVKKCEMEKMKVMLTEGEELPRCTDPIYQKGIEKETELKIDVEFQLLLGIEIVSSIRSPASNSKRFSVLWPKKTT